MLAEPVEPVYRFAEFVWALVSLACANSYPSLAYLLSKEDIRRPLLETLHSNRLSVIRKGVINQTTSSENTIAKVI